MYDLDERKPKPCGAEQSSTHADPWCMQEHRRECGASGCWRAGLPKRGIRGSMQEAHVRQKRGGERKSARGARGYIAGRHRADVCRGGHAGMQKHAGMEPKHVPQSNTV
jgi:hypothetical protein